MADKIVDAADALNKVYPFRLMEDKDKAALVAHIETLDFSENSTVYRTGDDATALYLVLEGDVELNLDALEEDEAPDPLGMLHSGDLFGFELIESRATYRSNAVAMGGARLLRIAEKDLFEAVQAAPYLHVPLHLMMESFALSLNVNFSWREADEAVIYIARRHPLFLWVKILPWLFLFLVSTLMLAYLALAIPTALTWGIILGLLSLVGGLASIWFYFDWSNDYAIITSRRVLFLEKVYLLYDSRQEAPLETVLSNVTDTSQVGRILGYGDLVLKTFTGTIILPNISKPDIVSLILQDRRSFMQVAQRQADLREVERVVKERIYPQPPEPPTPSAEEGEGESAASETAERGEDEEEAEAQGPSRAAERLANLLQMRSEEGGIITYRQHWLILLRQVFMPLFLLLLLLVLLVLGAFNILTLVSAQAMAALSLLAAALLLFWLWYQYEDWANDKYILTADQLVDVYKKPLGEEEKRSAPLKNIQSVEFEKLGIVRLVMNFGTVFIRIGDTQFTFDNVYNPSDVQREILRRMDALNYREKKKETDTVRAGILDMLEAYHKLSKEEEKRAREENRDRQGEPPEAAP